VTTLPPDIKPDWLNIIRRLQSVGRKRTGYAVVTIQVIVDANGTPVLWLEPDVKGVEPGSRVMDALMKVMSGS
jgi:hypothetical protein